jgi:hypothetical protein
MRPDLDALALFERSRMGASARLAQKPGTLQHHRHQRIRLRTMRHTRIQRLGFVKKRIDMTREQSAKHWPGVQARPCADGVAMSAIRVCLSRSLPLGGTARGAKGAR